MSFKIRQIFSALYTNSINIFYILILLIACTKNKVRSGPTALVIYTVSYLHSEGAVSVDIAYQSNSVIDVDIAVL